MSMSPHPTWALLWAGLLITEYICKDLFLIYYKDRDDWISKLQIILKENVYLCWLYWILRVIVGNIHNHNICPNFYQQKQRYQPKCKIHLSLKSKLRLYKVPSLQQDNELLRANAFVFFFQYNLFHTHTTLKHFKS